MPVISVQLGNKQVEDKGEFIKKLTETASSLTSIPESSFTVFIEEYDLDNVGIGGQTLREKRAAR